MSTPSSSIAWVSDVPGSQHRRRVLPPAGADGDGYVLTLFDEYMQHADPDVALADGLRPPDLAGPRPTVNLLPASPLAAPHMGPTDVSFVNVPPDGNCFFHCWSAAQNAQAWLQDHRPNGFGINPWVDSKDKGDAERLRNELADFAMAAGKAEAAARLRADGIAGYIEEEDIAIAAEHWKCQILMQCGSRQRLFGHGPLRAHILYCMVADGEGHASGHYVLVQSWVPRGTEGVTSQDNVIRSLVLFGLVMLMLLVWLHLALRKRECVR